MNLQYSDGVSPIRTGASLRDDSADAPLLSRPSGLFYEIEALVGSIRKMERATGDAQARLRQAETLYLQERAKAEDFGQRLRTIDAEHGARVKALNEQILALQSERDKLLTQYRQLAAAFKKARLDGEQSKRRLAETSGRLDAQERQWEQKVKESEAKFARVDSQREQLQNQSGKIHADLENWRERANTAARRLQEVERSAAQASHERAAARAETERSRLQTQTLERDLARYQQAWRALAERESQGRRQLAEVQSYTQRLQGMKGELEQWKLHSASLQQQVAGLSRGIEQARKEQSQGFLQADRARAESEKEIMRLKAEVHRALSDAASERENSARLQAELLEQKDQARADAMRLQSELGRLRETYPMRDLVAFKDAQSRRVETMPRPQPVPPPFPGYHAMRERTMSERQASEKLMHGNRAARVEPIAMEVLETMPPELSPFPPAPLRDC